MAELLSELLVRFVLGGLIVSAFAVVGDLLRPKSFAGLFGAAPSVALATLSLAFLKDGGPYPSLEGRSMMVGAVAFSVYSLVVSRTLLRREGRPPMDCLAAAGLAWLAWLAAAFGLRAAVLP